MCAMPEKRRARQTAAPMCTAPRTSLLHDLTSGPWIALSAKHSAHNLKVGSSNPVGDWSLFIWFSMGMMLFSVSFLLQPNVTELHEKSAGNTHSVFKPAKMMNAGCQDITA